MARIARGSELKSRRFQALYAKHLNNPENIRRVEAADPIKKIENHVDYPSEHYLDFYNNYYQSISDLKKEFKDFYDDERALKTALDDLDNNQGMFEEKLRTLIDKYNEALDSLKELDQAMNTKHILEVKSKLAKHYKTLHRFGVYETADGNIDLDEKKFCANLDVDSAAPEKVFIPLKQVVLSIHKALHSIRIPEQNKKNTNKYRQQQDMRGLFIENKL